MLAQGFVRAWLVPIFLCLPLVSLGADARAEDRAATIPQWQPTAKPWSRSWGTHRVVVHVAEAELPARVSIPWRRRDPQPEKKAVLVHSLAQDKPVQSVQVLRLDAEAGEICFTPEFGGGEYTVYFLPVKIVGGAFPSSRYEPA